MPFPAKLQPYIIASFVNLVPFANLPQHILKCASNVGLVKLFHLPQVKPVRVRLASYGRRKRGAPFGGSVVNATSCASTLQLLLTTAMAERIDYKIARRTCCVQLILLLPRGFWLKLQKCTFTVCTHRHAPQNFTPFKIF